MLTVSGSLQNITSLFGIKGVYKSSEMTYNHEVNRESQMATVFDFMDEGKVDVSTERRNRIRLSLAAYAYEIENETIMSDAEFDALALSINPKMSTVETNCSHKDRRRIEILDQFWERQFQPDTGMWIHRHPELGLIEAKYHYLKELGAFKRETINEGF